MEIKDRRAKLNVGVVTDGNAGNAAQAMALAEALGRRRPINIVQRVAHAKGWQARLPAAAVHQALLMTGTDDIKVFEPGWPDLVIGAGRRVAPLVAAIGRTETCKTVQVLWPQMPADAFFRVIVPRHDQKSGDNIIETLGAMSSLTADVVFEAGTAMAKQKQLPAPRIAALIGGPSKSSGFDADLVKRVLEDIAQTHSLLVTPSRRTPEGLASNLAWRLGERGEVWDGTGENPYPGILALADAILVTSDSVNMASEAASTGKPVHILTMPDQSPKFQRFHEDLEGRGISRPYNGKIESWNYEPLAEADRVAAILERDLQKNSTR